MKGFGVPRMERLDDEELSEEEPEVDESRNVVKDVKTGL